MRMFTSCGIGLLVTIMVGSLNIWITSELEVPFDAMALLEPICLGLVLAILIYLAMSLVSFFYNKRDRAMGTENENDG